MHESKRAAWGWSWIVHGVRLGQVNPVLPGEPTPPSDSDPSIGLCVVCLIILSVCGELRVKRTSGPTVRSGFQIGVGCRGRAIVGYCGGAQAFWK